MEQVVVYVVLEDLGSGTYVYGVYRSREDAERAVEGSTASECSGYRWVAEEVLE